MGFAIRSRRLIVQGILVGAFALTAAFGFATHHASASTATGSTCDAYYDAAMYAAARWQAASRNGDTINANFWWSVYNHNELSYVRAGCLNETT
jgi:hypothetical protein